MMNVSPDLPIRILIPPPWRPLIICVIIIVFTCSCTSQEEKSQLQDQEKVYSEINGFKVPNLQSGPEQLSLALATDGSSPHRIALFKAVTILFPEDKTLTGQAELEIAYLGLGTDYRRSTPDQLNSSASIYMQIASNYHNIPEVAAKALWYHGWISADLLGEKAKGMNSFQKIIDSHPNQQILDSIIVPRTSINLKQQPPPIFQESSQTPLTWGEFAYLELVRHGQSTAISLAYYRSLTLHAQSSVIIPAALKLLAAREDLSSKAIHIIQTEITKANLEILLKEELSALLQKKKTEVGR